MYEMSLMHNFVECYAYSLVIGCTWIFADAEFEANARSVHSQQPQKDPESSSASADRRSACPRHPNIRTTAQLTRQEHAQTSLSIDMLA